jgi:lipopolysaccharide/colanic/teichoic acid biosynthesis glycosyltransferase
VQSTDFGCIPVQFSASRPQAPVWKLIEFAERFAACGLLALVSPLLAVAMISITVLSRRSPLIAHRRVGHFGRDIWVLKLRTMWDRAKRSPSPLIERIEVSPAEIQFSKNGKDPRVTSSFASLCRRYSIDELPQLWNVLCGEMSLVGPRPITALELETYYGLDAQHTLAIKPGITGLWQVHGRSRLTYTQRRRLDLLLVRKWSILLYLRILLSTPARVLAGKDAW